MLTDAQHPPCPRCNSTETIPIVYGYPGMDLFEASERGEVSLGGCVVWDDMPEFECKSCGESFSKRA